MAKVNINGQSYEVHEEVAEQFSKHIRRLNVKDKLIAGMAVAINQLQEKLDQLKE